MRCRILPVAGLGNKTPNAGNDRKQKKTAQMCQRQPLHYATADKFENAVLIPGFRPPSTLIRHENGASREQEEFENAGFAFSFGRKTF